MAAIKSIVATLLLVLTGCCILSAAEPPTPPEQQDKGPGGSDLPHADVAKNRYGTAGREYWLYEPDSPKVASAPVIVFLHGWSATNPMIYGSWIDHLVKRGNIVIYPRYQENLHTPLAEFAPNTIAAVQDALRRLQKEPGHVRPELDKFAVVGHSAGALTAANLAALAAESALPKVRALMVVQPGRTWNPRPSGNIPLADMSKIPADTLLLTVVGDRDTLARDIDAKRVFRETTRIPIKNKNYVTLVSDDHGQPILSASHYAPVSIEKKYSSGEIMQASDNAGMRERVREKIQERVNTSRSTSQSTPSVQTEIPGQPPTIGYRPGRSLMLNALDYYGTWKLFDALCDAAFYGKNRDYALGNTPHQRFMGLWSDGVPVKELIITTKP